ncbi:hypothetical protein, partial [Endozoicomonas sp. ALB122]|uniref:hypothetical protein n=1 Tax=Endozoicomonas sp. ALB122 TaxID=3403075 RepID=UPI003BB53E57
MHTSPEKRTLQHEMAMGSHAGAWEPEFCDSLTIGGGRPGGAAQACVVSLLFCHTPLPTKQKPRS